LAAERQSDLAVKIFQPGAGLGVAFEQGRNRLAEDPAWAAGIDAEEASEANVEQDGPTLDRQVAGPADVTAVDPAGGQSAERTGGRVGSGSETEGDVRGRELGAVDVQTGAGRQEWKQSGSPPGVDGPEIGRHLVLPALGAYLSSNSRMNHKLDAEAFAVLLRVEDRQEQRQTEGFKGRWRKNLHTANFLQFVPGFEWGSAEAIEILGPVSSATPPATKPREDDPLAELITYCDPRCHDLLREVVARGCGVPEIGFELQDEQGRVCAEAELAWPDKKVAVVLPERIIAADNFRGRGWSVFDPAVLPNQLPCG
jgi:hypothetical protein